MFYTKGMTKRKESEGFVNPSIVNSVPLDFSRNGKKGQKPRIKVFI